MNELLIKNASFPNGSIQDVWIVGSRIKQIAAHLSIASARVIDASGKFLIPGFVNGHTHAAMTLLRGFADDLKLKPWLEEHIWPNEAKLTEEDIYWGTKLACLEMIKTGTTTFSDMYFQVPVTARAVEEMGLRAVLSAGCMDHFNADLRENAKKQLQQLTDHLGTLNCELITQALGPHAIYTVSAELLQWLHAFAEERQLPIHLHLAETEGEVQDAIKNFGTTPVRYLYRLGLLSPRLILAHGLYVDDEEIRMLADAGVKVVHNPASNLKLASGVEFRFHEMKQAGVAVALGTDGCASSNNLDMIEVMKLAALLGKGWRKDPEVLPATEVFAAATQGGAALFGHESGRVEEGAWADLLLIDVHSPAFTPNFNFISNLVYSANGSCVDTTIVGGRVLMENRRVAGEDEILRQASERAFRLVGLKK